MSVHALLKIKICLQPFITHRSICEAKLYGWNFNNITNFVKYPNTFHAGAKTENV